jgi:hypothetical protein
VSLAFGGLKSSRGSSTGNSGAFGLAFCALAAFAGWSLFTAGISAADGKTAIRHKGHQAFYRLRRLPVCNFPRG